MQPAGWKQLDNNDERISRDSDSFYHLAPFLNSEPVGFFQETVKSHRKVIFHLNDTSDIQNRPIFIIMFETLEVLTNLFLTCSRPFQFQTFHHELV